MFLESKGKNMDNTEFGSHLDPNKIAAEFISSNIATIFEQSGQLLKGTQQKIRLRLEKTYGNYLQKTLTNHLKTKSFFSRTEAVEFYSVYVESRGLKSRSKSEFQINRMNIDKAGKGIVVVGSAGSGKSMCMKHLLIEAARSNQIPILIELRKLNNSDLTVRDLINNTLITNGLKLDVNYISEALNLLNILILLDGYDEVEHEKRGSVSEQILEIQSDYPNVKVVVSSRPDNEFSSWTNFTTIELAPLNLSNALLLISLLPYDEEIKDKFSSELKVRLFDSHNTFLSNPLLLTIMLLAYSQSGDIPGKLTLFYNQAFEALYERHDAYKGAFRRDRKCGLDISDFERVFSAFCLQTYDARAFEFTRQDALKYIELAVEITGIEVHPPEFLDDCLQGTTLLLEDGLLIVFAHRSFQEYFVAKFLANAPFEIQGTLIKRVVIPEEGQDLVLNLLWELDRALVEREYVIPGLRMVASQIKFKKNIGITHYSKYIKMVYDEMECSDIEFQMMRINSISMWRPIIFTVQHYMGNLTEYTLSRNLSTKFLKPIFGHSSKETNKINFAKLTIKSKFIQDLFGLGKKSIFWGLSPQLLQRLMELPDKLESAHSENKQTIMDILKPKLKN
jgi:hypothetical protein